MKRFVLAIVLTGLTFMTAQAGNIPTNGVVGEVPINGVAAPTATPTTSSTLLTNAVLTIITTLIGR